MLEWLLRETPSNQEWAKDNQMTKKDQLWVDGFAL
jgi:hypothetical protein